MQSDSLFECALVTGNLRSLRRGCDLTSGIPQSVRLSHHKWRSLQAAGELSQGSYDRVKDMVRI